MTDPAARIARAALACYVSATLLGVVMRLQLAGVGVAWPFDHILHAHSHVLYFGWAGLGVLASLLGLSTPRPRLLDVLSIGVAVSMVPMGLAFLAFGYNPISIAVSTVVMFGWYGIVAGWWRSVSGERGPHLVALRAGVVYLVVASAGVWALAGLQASGRGTPFTESLAVHAFLSGFGWFIVLSLAGLLVQQSEALGLDLDGRRVATTVRWWAALAWATFPLGVIGGPEWQPLGPASRVAGLLLLVPAWSWVSQLWRGAAPGRHGDGWRWAAGWFAVTGVTLAAVSAFGSTAIDFAGRQGVVIHLHALFVGFVTTVLVMLHRPEASRSLTLHQWALVSMLASLAVSVVAWPDRMMGVAALCSVVLWTSGVGWAVGPEIRRHLFGHTPEGAPHRPTSGTNTTQILERGQDLVGGGADHRQ